MMPPIINQVGRFIVATPTWRLEDGTPRREYELHGGQNPTLFKLYRNAKKCARSVFRELTRHDGIILLFDAEKLPIVHPDELIEREPGLADRISELEFAERQVQLWADVAEKIRSAPPPIANPTTGD